MEKSSSSSNPNLVCKKILNAFADFQKILPFSSDRRQDPSSARALSPENPNMPGKYSPLQFQTTPAKVGDKKPKSAMIEQEIPIQSDPPAGVQIRKTGEEKQRSKTEEKVKASGKEGKDDRFTDYINEAKVKMRRSKSDIEGEKQMEKRSDATAKDESKDKFSNYISRAGNKMRTTSSNLGFGKAALVKRE